MESSYIGANRLSFHGLGQPRGVHYIMKAVNISQKQANEFARAIFTDIHAYIERHQAEYEAFLKENGLFEQEGGEN